MGLVPDSFALLEPVIDSRDIRGLSRPGKERGLVTEYALKRCEAHGWLVEGDLGVLGPAQEQVPGILVAMAEGSQEVTNFLYLTFHLSIRLGVIARGKTYGHT